MFVTKLVERAVFNQTNEHMLKFQLYPLLQSAFRAGHSTEAALLKIQNDILLNIDHQVFKLNRLEPRFGLTGTVLQWFRSYLTVRSNRIV